MGKKNDSIPGMYPAARISPLPPCVFEDLEKHFTIGA